ncbi:DUF2971 domain-containing protein [Vibrio natriegens]|uniref:DUF2971 domain-containing protein n=1 Tax=Vibrio natriegens TaxID=691 RepID=UPI0022850C80|nr:DUF2971 domain-containing protein [Vibrio natriegens]MCY9877306.1 DUF2971 domain-containing protein [Vibrio natriegens]
MSNSCFHYTSIEALFHIVTNKSLHFGSFGMMNDPLETKIDNDLLHELYASEFTESELPQRFYFKRNNTDEFQYRSFGFSTSKNGDDLSQWRSYTQKGQGVCIEFDKEELEKQLLKLLRVNMPVSYECIYSKQKERDLLQHYVQSVRENDWYKAMNQFNPDFFNHDHSKWDYVIALQEMAIQIKHESFKSESEVRFFILQDNFNGNIEIKPCAAGLTRYVNVSITPDCIKSIRMGPLVDKRNNFMIQELFFSKMGKIIEIAETTSPYV